MIGASYFISLHQAASSCATSFHQANDTMSHGNYATAGFLHFSISSVLVHLRCCSVSAVLTLETGV